VPPTDAVTIRPAAPADLPVLGRLGALLVRLHHEFDATVAALAARGAPRVVLMTAERNETAQRLFARAGFRRTMIEMTRELDGDAF
jgi:RimJ/RimL family protein N-acetyltransferase